MKCIDEEIPYEIPIGWEWVRIHSIFRTSSGGTPDKGHVEYYSNPTIPWLRSGELDYKYVTETELKISKSGMNNSSAKLFPVNTVVVAMYGATVGQVSILGIETTTNQAICGIFPVDGILPEYLYYFFQAKRTDYLEKAFGSGQPNISQDVIKKTLLPIPPYEEQQRIVAKADYISALIDKFDSSQQRLNSLNTSIKTNLRKSILQEAIQGRLINQDLTDEPVCSLLERINKEKERLLKKGFLKKKDIVDSVIFKGEDNKYYENVDGKIVDISEEIPFDLPETWEWCRLATIVHYRIGKTPARGEASFWEPGAIPWVSISDMKDYGMVTRTKETVSEKATSLLGSITAKGILLMSFKLTVGRTSILGIDAYHNEAIISIWPFAAQDAMKYYLFYTLPLLANLGDSKDAIKGKTLNTNSINNLLIPLPPENEQIRIVEKIKELYERL